MKSKTLCCPWCGSDDIHFSTWVDELGVVDNIGGGYAICVNQDCDVANDQIEPILKSEFTKEVT